MRKAVTLLPEEGLDPSHGCPDGILNAVATIAYNAVRSFHPRQCGLHANGVVSRNGYSGASSRNSRVTPQVEGRAPLDSRHLCQNTDPVVVGRFERIDESLQDINRKLDRLISGQTGG